MISLKKFLDEDRYDSTKEPVSINGSTAAVAIAAYRSALAEMGTSSVQACPGIGSKLKEDLDAFGRTLLPDAADETLRKAEVYVSEQLRQWGQGTARHYLKKSDEVRELLMTMARMAESVTDRDERCAAQIKDVTATLTEIASLDDLTVIRASIAQSAQSLKSSIERMTTEGKAAMEGLRLEVATYRTKLEKAEELAFRDALTGIRNRLCIERYMERSLSERIPFCVAILDIDLFKQINDQHGHLVGDEVLKQFARELKSSCRANDMVGRWGGDEFILVLPGTIEEASAQSTRVSKWVCGDYTVQTKTQSLKLRVNASIGMAEANQPETLEELLARADADMYRHKEKSRR